MAQIEKPAAQDTVSQAWDAMRPRVTPGEERANLLPMWKGVFGEDIYRRVLWVDPPRAFAPGAIPSRVNILMGNVGDENMAQTMKDITARLKEYATNNVVTPFGNPDAKRMPSFRLEGTRYDPDKHVMLYVFTVAMERVRDAGRNGGSPFAASSKGQQ